MNPSPISEHDHVDGSAEASVTLIEYGDYECPFCAQAYPIIEKARQAMGKELRFVYRHVPKAGPAGFAKQAAEASEFAASEGLFWPMHRQLSLHPGKLDLEHLVEHARSVGLDAERCRAALVEHRFAERVREIAVASVRSGIIGTPTLFINGQRYQDRLEDALLQQALQAAFDKRAADR